MTRPVLQARSLADSIEQAGGQSVIFPAVEILPADLKPLSAAIAHLKEYQQAIFLSANAVRYVIDIWPNPQPDLQIIAIGPGTAEALERAGITVNNLPKSYHSEGILMLASLQKIKGEKIVIFCGENTRSILKTTLINRGAQVDSIICYQRQCPKIDATHALADLQTCHFDFIISTSLESLNNLWQMLGVMGINWLKQMTWVVISPGMFSHAQQLGIAKIILSSDPTNQAIINSIQKFMSRSQ